MKRINRLILLLCMLFALQSAFALPLQIDTASSNWNGFQFIYESQICALDFDSNPEFSTIRDSTVQASFYAYGADNVTLYELYLCFPTNVQSGSRLVPGIQTDAEVGITLFISDLQSELYATATQYEGYMYPQEADFSIQFTTVEQTKAGVLYAGTVDATLYVLNSYENPDYTNPLYPIEMTNATFSFTMPSVIQDLPSPDSVPYSTDPFRFGIIPPDARKI